MTTDEQAHEAVTVLLPLSQAAPRLGLTPAGLRSRIRRGAVTAKKGNDGRLLIEVPADAAVRREAVATTPDIAHDDELAELQAEIGDLREALARAEERALAVRELADRLTAELADARRELADARRPWLARVLAAILWPGPG